MTSITSYKVGLFLREHLPSESRQASEQACLNPSSIKHPRTNLPIAPTCSRGSGRKRKNPRSQLARFTFNLPSNWSITSDSLTGDPLHLKQSPSVHDKRFLLRPYSLNSELRPVCMPSNPGTRSFEGTSRLSSVPFSGTLPSLYLTPRAQKDEKSGGDSQRKGLLSAPLV